MAASTDQTRQPHGIPSGGQFAQTARDEAGVALDPEVAGESCCAECGGPSMPDPAGSPGVMVHADQSGGQDFETDADHPPVPEPDPLGGH